MLHKKPNRKSGEFRELHDAIYMAYNENKLSITDIQVLIDVLEQLKKNPNTIFHVPFAEVRERDKDGDFVHFP